MHALLLGATSEIPVSIARLCGELCRLALYGRRLSRRAQSAFHHAAAQSSNLSRLRVPATKLHRTTKYLRNRCPLLGGGFVLRHGDLDHPRHVADELDLGIVLACAMSDDALDETTQELDRLGTRVVARRMEASRGEMHAAISDDCGGSSIGEPSSCRASPRCPVGSITGMTKARTWHLLGCDRYPPFCSENVAPARRMKCSNPPMSRGSQLLFRWRPRIPLKETNGRAPRRRR